MRRQLVSFSFVLLVGLVCGQLLPACSSGATLTQEKPPAPQPTASAEKSEPATAVRGKSYVIGGKTYYAPVAVKGASRFLDGGTLTLLIVDSRGKELQACNDGRGIILDKKTKPKGERPIYIGGYHPIDKKARPLELGGADEQALYRMLKDWFEEAQKQGGPKFENDSIGMEAKAATDFVRYLERRVERYKPK